MSASVGDRVLLCLEETVSTSAEDDIVVEEEDTFVVDVGSSSKRALECPTLLGDRRVLDNLLLTECSYIPANDYFDAQREVEPHMRNMVAGWMQEVLAEQRCEDDVYPLSINYLDRVLSRVSVRKTQLQLVAAVCMFVASKYRDTVALSAEKLVMYTDYSITLDQLLEWELVVLQLLDWDLSAVTAHDFLEQLLTRLPVDTAHVTAVKRHAQTFITMCSAEVAFISCLPSTMAAASVSSAASGLLGHVWCHKHNLLHKLHRLVKSADIASIKSCQDQIEQLFNNNVRPSSADQPSDVTPTPPSTPTSKSSCCPSLPATPTDVRDIRVCH